MKILTYIFSLCLWLSEYRFVITSSSATNCYLHSVRFIQLCFYIEEKVIFGEENEISFNGMEMATHEALPLGNVDFSLCVNIKTRQAGTVASNFPEDRRWKNESKALFVDATGVAKFVCGGHTLCESFSQINDDSWHEIGVVYSSEDKR